MIIGNDAAGTQDDLSLSTQQKMMKSVVNKKMTDTLTNQPELRPLFSKRNLPVFEDSALEPTPRPEADPTLEGNENLNLIVSGMFLGGSQGGDDELPEGQALNEEEFMDLDRFEEMVLKLNPKTLNPHKILHYLEFLDSQNLMFRWDQGDRLKYEGFILMLIHNDAQFLNAFIFKPYLQRFISGFVKHFEEDYKAEIAGQENVLLTAPNLLLLVSFNNDLCDFLEMHGLHDQFNSCLEALDDAYMPLYMRVLINVVERSPTVLEHLLGYQFFPLFIEKLNLKGNLNNLVLFLQLVLAIRYATYQIQEFFDHDLMLEILNSLQEHVDADPDFEILSANYRHKIAPFDSRGCGNALDVLEKYHSENEKTIKAKLGKDEYTKLYFYAEVYMEFLRLNIHTLLQKKKMPLIKTAFNLYVVYFYQNSVAENFLACLAKSCNSRMLGWLFEHFYTETTIMNLTGGFEYTEHYYLTPQHISLMIQLQRLFIRTLDVIHAQNKGLTRQQAKLLLDGVYLIKKACDIFNNKIKETYLAKGLVKFIRKIKTDLDTILVKPFQTIQSNNNLILGKISHCFDFNESIEHLLKRSLNVRLIQNGKKIEAHDLIRSVRIWEKPIYFAAKGERTDDIISEVEDNIIKICARISSFSDFIIDRNIECKFEEIHAILDFLLLALYYLKAKAPKGKTTRSSSDRTIRTLTQNFNKILSNVKTFVDVNYNNQIYLLLEQFNLFFFLYADFDIELLEKLPLYFLSSLKSRYIAIGKNEMQTTVNKNKVSMDSNLVNGFLNFLNEFVDLKTKSVYLNFLIMKQIDTMYIYLKKTDPLNDKLMKKIFSKALSVEFTDDLHRISPKYLISYSIEFLDQRDIFDAFLPFVIRNNLFLNSFVRKLLRDLIPKNFPKKQLVFRTANQRLLFSRLILNESPEELYNKMMLYVIDRTSRSANLRSLFCDHIEVFHELVEEAPEEEFNQKIVRQILQNTTLMDRLMRLYQSDKVNLERVLVSLMELSHKFGMISEIKLPQQVIRSTLSITDPSQNTILARQILTHFVANDAVRDEYTDDLKKFLRNTKSFLDSQILFRKAGTSIRPSNTVHSTMALANFCVGPLQRNPDKSIVEFTMPEGFDGLDQERAQEYLVKFVFAHFEKFDELELMHLNNVFAYFSKFHPQTEDVGQIKAFQRELNAQRELMLLLVKLLRDVEYLNKQDDIDAQTKILSHLYYILNKRNRESFMDFTLEMIRSSLNLTADWEIEGFTEDEIKERLEREEEKQSELIKDEKEEISQAENKSTSQNKNDEKSQKEEGEENETDFNTKVDIAVINNLKYEAFRENIRNDMNQEMFLDMYFLLDYEFNISRPLHKIIEEKDETKKDEEIDHEHFKEDPELENQDEITEQDMEREEFTQLLNEYMINTFSSLDDVSEILDRKMILSRSELHNTDINRIVRGCLRLLHFIKHNPEQVDKKSTLVARILDFMRVLMEQFFNQIHKYPKIEKMILEVLVKFRKASPVKSNPLAGVFLKILNQQPSFKLSSLVDKFLYMGLFTSYFDAAKKVSRLKINEDTLMLEPVKTPRDYQMPDFEKTLVQDTILLLDMDLTVENEIITLKFLKKLIRLDRTKFYCPEVCPPEEILKKIFIGAGALLKKRNEDWTEPQFVLLKRRLRMAKLSLNWLRPENFEERQGKEQTKKKKKLFDEAPPDPFGTINQLSYGYRESVNAQYNTLTAHYEPLTDRESKFDTYATKYGTYKTANITGLEIDAAEPDEVSEEVYSSSEWLAVQIKDYIEATGDVREYLKTDTQFRVLRKCSEYIYSLLKLLRSNHRTQIKGVLVDCLYRLIDPVLPESDRRFLALQNIVILMLLKLSQNKYDELRILKHKDMIKKLMAPMVKDKDYGTMNFNKVEYSKEEINNVKTLTLRRNQEGLYEKSLIFFLMIVKNELYMKLKQQNEIIKMINYNKGQCIVSAFSRFVYLKLSLILNGEEISYYLEKSTEVKESLPEGLNRRQKNVLYVQKVLSNLAAKLDIQESFDEKQLRFLNFTLTALKHHMLFGLDPEIFIRLKFGENCLRFAIEEKIRPEFRKAFLEVVLVYLRRTRKSNQFTADGVKEFLEYYRNIDLTTDVGFPVKYYKATDLLYKYVDMDKDYISERFDSLKDFVFFEKEEQAPLHVENMFMLVRLFELDPNTNLDDFRDNLQEFVRQNHKKLSIREKGHILELYIGLERRGVHLSTSKIKPFLSKLSLNISKNSRRQVRWCLRSLNICAKSSMEFKEYMFFLGFEIFFKTAMKKFGTHKELLRPLCESYLQYTFNLEENKFEIAETIVYMIKRLEDYHAKKDTRSMMYILKCFVNSSLLKPNAEVMINSRLNSVLPVVVPAKDTRFGEVTIALLFNLTFVFDKGEIRVADFVNRGLLKLVSQILEHAILNEQEDLVNETIDLFIAFIQHEFFLFFTVDLIKMFKFALNFYYHNTAMLSKFLNILKDLSFSKNAGVKRLIREEFDFLFLYHIHFRNLKHRKLNLTAKSIILNLLKAEPDRWTENSLLMHGVPENIIHTFSFADDFSVMSANLEIIEFSLRHQKCMFYVKDNFMDILTQILTQFSFHPKKESTGGTLNSIKEENEDEEDLENQVTESQVIDDPRKKNRMYPTQITFRALDILLILYENFGDIEMISAYYYLDDLDQIELLLDFYQKKPRYLTFIAKIFRSVIENQPELADDVKDSLRNKVKEILQSRDSPTDRDFLDDIYYVLSRIELSKARNNDRYELITNKLNVPYKDKIFMDKGEKCMMILDDHLLKHCSIRFDFVTDMLVVTHKVSPAHKAKSSDHTISQIILNKGELRVKMKHLSQPRALDSKERLKLQEFFRSYFNKQLRREKYLPLGVQIDHNESLVFKNLYFVFSNDFKCRKWTSLINELFNINQSNTMK